MTLGRITPATYKDDPHLENLIATVPFGLPSARPERSGPGLRGAHPGFGENDKIVLWSGGLYNWFDPFTLIHAIAALATQHSDIRLYFQGTKHPHPGVPEMPVVGEARELARSLGILDSHVFFNDSWVPYDQRQNYLLDADLGVSTHRSHIETTFSFRTRILDYLWASLPMVVTEGDYFGDLVAERGLGKAVPAGDVEALTAALETMLYNDQARQRAIKAVKSVREDFEWSRVLAPRVDYVDRVGHGDR
jgi:glycosyltransferase involved in cell wall biosynthesis